MTIDRKTCSVCGIEKSVSDFRKRNSSKDGKTAACKACLFVREKTYYRGRVLSDSGWKSLIETKRKYRDKNREKARAYGRKYYEANKRRYVRNSKVWVSNNPEKVQAHKILCSALKREEIIRPASCSRCGINCKPDAHHADYSKPLDVIWLCRKCHRLEHSHTFPRKMSDLLIREPII